VSLHALSCLNAYQKACDPITSWMLFLSPNQQRQSTECTSTVSHDADYYSLLISVVSVGSRLHSLIAF